MPFQKIMIVDDSEAEQFLCKHLIQSINAECKISSAFDGQEALDMLEKLAPDERPNCILLDINMPRMNGFDFLEVYSDCYKNDPVVIVMLTSSIQEKDKEKALSYDCVSDFIIKPLSQESLKKLSKQMN